MDALWDAFSLQTYENASGERRALTPPPGAIRHVARPGAARAVMHVNLFARRGISSSGGDGAYAYAGGGGGGGGDDSDGDGENVYDDTDHTAAAVAAAVASTRRSNSNSSGQPFAQRALRLRALHEAHHQHEENEDDEQQQQQQQQQQHEEDEDEFAATALATAARRAPRTVAARRKRSACAAFVPGANKRMRGNAPQQQQQPIAAVALRASSPSTMPAGAVRGRRVVGEPVLHGPASASASASRALGATGYPCLPARRAPGPSLLSSHFAFGGGGGGCCDGDDGDDGSDDDDAAAAAAAAAPGDEGPTPAPGADVVVEHEDMRHILAPSAERIDRAFGTSGAAGPCQACTAETGRAAVVPNEAFRQMQSMWRAVWNSKPPEQVVDDLHQFYQAWVARMANASAHPDECALPDWSRRSMYDHFYTSKHRVDSGVDLMDSARKLREACDAMYDEDVWYERRRADGSTAQCIDPQAIARWSKMVQDLMRLHNVQAQRMVANATLVDASTQGGAQGAHTRSMFAPRREYRRNPRM